MSFVYEIVGEENRELWESIGWKDWRQEPFRFYEKDYWSVDKENKTFLVEIGGFIDTPNYFDMYYQGHIIRMEASGRSEGTRPDLIIRWKVFKIYIPKSLWHAEDDILLIIKDAFSVVRNLVSEREIKNIEVEILCEAECIEADYNGR